MQTCALPTASREVEAAALDELLGRMHWQAGEFGELRMAAGHSRRIEGAGVRFGYVADGAVTLRSPSVGRREVPAEHLQAGDVVLFARGAHEALAHAGGARLVMGDVHLDAAPFERVTELMPPALFSRGFRTYEPAYGAVLAMIDDEIAGPRPRGSAVLSRLIDLVIAATLGYDSAEGFRRAFQRHSGHAPTQWRRSMSEEKVGDRSSHASHHSSSGTMGTVSALVRTHRKP